MPPSNLFITPLPRSRNPGAGPVSASMRSGNTTLYEEMSQRWQAVGNTVSDLTRPRFKLLTSRSKDKRITARPTGGPETKYRFISWFPRRLICLLPLRFSPNLLFGRLTKLTCSTSSFFHMVKQQQFSKHALILFKLAVIVA